MSGLEKVGALGTPQTHLISLFFQRSINNNIYII